MTVEIAILVNEVKYILKSIEELVLLIDRTFEEKEFNEIWLSGHGTSCIAIFTNCTKVFAMYLREEGDSGFSSRSLKEDSVGFEDFKLSNGQVDEYPKNWLISKDEGKEVMKEYFKTGNKYMKVQWIEE